jgi:hypothetical protein
MGIGLPLSNMFATYVRVSRLRDGRLIQRRYFGGSLELVSLDGWGMLCLLAINYVLNVGPGSDAYLRLPKLVKSCLGFEYSLMFTCFRAAILKGLKFDGMPLDSTRMPQMEIMHDIRCPGYSYDPIRQVTHVHLERAQSISVG